MMEEDLSYALRLEEDPPPLFPDLLPPLLPLLPLLLLLLVDGDDGSEGGGPHPPYHTGLPVHPPYHEGGAPHPPEGASALEVLLEELLELPPDLPDLPPPDFPDLPELELELESSSSSVGAGHPGGEPHLGGAPQDGGAPQPGGPAVSSSSSALDVLEELLPPDFPDLPPPDFPDLPEVVVVESSSSSAGAGHPGGDPQAGAGLPQEGGAPHPGGPAVSSSSALDVLEELLPPDLPPLPPPLLPDFPLELLDDSDDSEGTQTQCP